MVVVLGFVRIVPAELWTLALIYRMLFPGAFARQLRVHQPGLISGYTGIRGVYEVHVCVYVFARRTPFVLLQGGSAALFS